jgi:hypothetical protein
VANWFQLQCFSTRALELALAANNWPEVATCKAQLHTNKAANWAGLDVCTHTPLSDDELPDIFHLAVEGCFGPSPGLTAHQIADTICPNL